jgi:XTP/dITP diphosphohydrolase
VDIVFATTNRGKVLEFETIMRELSVNAHLHTLDALGIDGEIDETGETFAENACIKAMHAYNLLKSNGLAQSFDCDGSPADIRSQFKIDATLVIAEDSGLEIPALGNWPGINSKRIAQKDVYRIALVNSAVNEYRLTMKRTAGDDSDMPIIARFVCYAAVVRDAEVLLQTHGEVEGIIKSIPSGGDGFGYDPIFYYPPAGCTFAEMTREEKSRVSHRRRALKKVCEWIKQSNLVL